MLFRQLLQSIPLFLAVFAVSQPAFAKDGVKRPAPEIATGKQAKFIVSGQKMMVVSAHPQATQAGYEILRKGGTAADAAIAVQLVLGMVEPQSSGIGGGGFALYYDAENKQLVTLDGRETAPLNAGKHLFTDKDGQILDFYDASIGGRAVGVPGMVRMMEKLHGWYGKMPWQNLFEPAIKTAEQGTQVTPRLFKMLSKERSRFDVDVKAKLYFYPDAETPARVGDVLTNPEYAHTLRMLASEGPNYFYRGELAKEIVAKVREEKTNRGLLSIEDMSAYKTKERKAVCGFYREYKVCSMGQPSSGGLTLLMTLSMLEKFDLRAMGAQNPKSWHAIAEASRLAFADRNHYMADPDFVETPDTLLLNPDYLVSRANYINLEGAMPKVTAGTPPNWNSNKEQSPDDALKPTGTSHITIVDGYGNVISMTTSIENAFGSRLMVGGFLLNNQLTDFSFKPHDEQGYEIANNVAGGKRPRSSMAPVIVFDEEGKPVMALGSAGGSRIIGYVLQRIIGVLDWDMDIQSALDMPNIVHRGKKLEVETTGVDFAEPLKNFGHPVEVGPMNSGLTAIHFKNGQIFGAADSRRDGVALGE